ncbi:MAG: PilZ domain-containing protein [candidate division FCPU426 bacterium]
MEKNQRCYPRKAFRFPVHYKYFENGKMFHALTGEAMNIGAKGLAMRNDHPIQHGRKLLATLWLPLSEMRGNFYGPEGEMRDNLPVMVFSQVAWCQRQSQDQYLTGLQFLALDISHQRRLRQFLDNHDIYRQAAYDDFPVSDENEP